MGAQETQIQALGQEEPLEQEVAPRSSALAWKVPWVEEPGKPQSVGRKESDATEHVHRA